MSDLRSRLAALTFDANDAERLADFWHAMLEWERPVVDERDGFTLRPTDDTGFDLRFMPTDRPKTVGNIFHFDLKTESDEHQAASVAKAVELGARHIDVGQKPEEGHVVLADPDGNEFCVLEAGNNFLAECGFLGALSGDGSQEVGYFWAEALGWPLVWDQDEETAIRSPAGGPKITWGGPPLDPRDGKSRVHLDLAVPVGGDHQVEVDRLVALGARPRDIGQGDVAWSVLTDPDGNVFCVLPPTSPDGASEA